MANNIFSWSTTPASNASVDGSDWSDGMNPGSVNNSARQDKASIRAFVASLAGADVAGGTSDALTLTSSVGIGALANGLVVGFKASADNTGAATLNVNSLGCEINPQDDCQRRCGSGRGRNPGRWDLPCPLFHSRKQRGRRLDTGQSDFARHELDFIHSDAHRFWYANRRGLLLEARWGYPYKISVRYIDHDEAVELARQRGLPEHTAVFVTYGDDE